MSTKFRKRPVVIDAVQYHGDTTVLPYEMGTAITRSYPNGPCYIGTLEGEMRCDVNDWIIRGVQGEFYPCKPSIFAATYEAVDTHPTSGAAPTMEPVPMIATLYNGATINAFPPERVSKPDIAGVAFVDGMFVPLDTYDALVANQAPVVDAVSDGDGKVTAFMPRVGGEWFVCPCGCNVFHKPSKLFPLLFRCNACEAEYEGEATDTARAASALPPTPTENNT